MTGLAAGIGVKAIAGGILGKLKNIPPKVWLIIAIVIALVIGVIWHGHAKKKFYDEAYRAGHQAALDEVAKQQKKLIDTAHKLKTEAETLQSAANKTIEVTHDQDIADIHHAADDLRVRYGTPAHHGTNGGHSADVPSSTSGGDDPARTFAIGEDQVLVSIPREDLIDAGEQCEIDRAALRAWQSWYPKQKAIWDDWVKRSSPK